MTLVLNEEKRRLLVERGVAPELISRITQNEGRACAVNCLDLRKLDIMLSSGEYYHDMVIAWIGNREAVQAFNTIDIARFKILFEDCMYHNDLMRFLLANPENVHVVNMIELERFTILFRGGIYRKHMMILGIIKVGHIKMINDLSFERIREMFENQNVSGSTMMTLLGHHRMIQNMLNANLEFLPCEPVTVESYTRVILKATTRSRYSFVPKREAYRDAMLKKYVKRRELIRTLEYINRLLGHSNVIEAFLGIELEKLLLLIQIDKPDNTYSLIEIGNFLCTIKTFNSIKLDHLRILLSNTTFASKYLLNLIRVGGLAEAINLMDIDKLEILTDPRFDHDKTMGLFSSPDAIHSFNTLTRENLEIILSNTDPKEYLGIFKDYKYGIRRNLDLALGLFKAGQIDRLSYNYLRNNHPLYDDVCKMFADNFPIDQIVLTTEVNEKGLVATLRDASIQSLVRKYCKTTTESEAVDVASEQAGPSGYRAVTAVRTVNQTVSSGILRVAGVTYSEIRYTSSFEFGGPPPRQVIATHSGKLVNPEDIRMEFEDNLGIAAAVLDQAESSNNGEGPFVVIDDGVIADEPNTEMDVEVNDGVGNLN